MNAVSIYQDVEFRINKSQNGELTYAQFNNISWLAQLRIIDWLTGSFSGNEPPEPYLTQKNRDWLSFLITAYRAQVADGIITRPEDYYQFENLSRITGVKQECEEDEEEDKPEDFSGLTVTLLSNDKFNQRLQTNIKALKPSFKKAIAKQVGLTFEFAPTDIGSVKLEYIRYPKRAEIKTKFDPIFNEDIPDEAASTNFEWGEEVREVLVYLIVQEYLAHTRESAGTALNKNIGKTIRG